MDRIACMGIVKLHAIEEVAGRLQYHKFNWMLLTKDAWGLSTVKDTNRFLFDTGAIENPAPPTFNQEQFLLVQNEVQELLVKQAIT